MIVYAAIVDGVTLLDSNDAEIGEYSESVIKVLKANFDERFESVNFEIESSSESGIITECYIMICLVILQTKMNITY